MSLLKVIEVLAESDKSWDDAAQQAVTKASKTVHNIKSVYNFEATVAQEIPHQRQALVRARLAPEP